MATWGGAWRSGGVLHLQDRGSGGGSSSACSVQRVSNPDGLLFLAAGSSAVAQSKAVHALEDLCEEDFPRARCIDAQLTIANRTYSRDDILEALEEDGAQAYIEHKKSGTRVAVAKFARLVGFTFGPASASTTSDTRSEEHTSELQSLMRIS